MSEKIQICESTRDFREFLYTNKGGKIQVRRGTWENIQNHRIYAKSLAKHYGYTTMEDWYQITKQQITDFYGGGIISNYYNNSSKKFVVNMFPDYDWKGYKFTKCSNEYWKEMQNRKSYVDDLGKHLGYITWEDWYQITQQHIKDFYGGGLLIHYYNDSPVKFVMDVYPEHNWKAYKFRQCSKKYWDPISNRIEYANYLGKRLGYITWEDWYQITKHQIIDFYGGGLLVSYYNGSPMKFVMDVFPDYQWKGYKFVQTSKEYWKSNRIEYANDLGEHLGYTKMKDWYQITAQQIIAFYGRGLLGYYNNSPMKFVMDMFPEHNWKGYKFTKCSTLYWKEMHNHESYAYDLGEHLGYTEIKDWYQITTQQIIDFYGSGLLQSYYNGSPMKFIMDMFPDYDWKGYKFGSAPNGYWDKIKNRIEYANDLCEHLGYTKMKDWYQITAQQILDFYGYGLLSHYYNGSPMQFVMGMFPEHNWKGYKFGSAPNGYWDPISNRKNYAYDLGEHLGYTEIKDWYQITTQQIIDFYGWGLLGGYYNGSPMKLVMDMFPDYHWDISKFSNHKTEKIVLKFLEKYDPSVIFQFKQGWCKAKRYLPFDFCLPELKILLELDGRQHFCQVSNWQSPEITQKRDAYKMKCANDNNYSVIRIVQEDILNNVYDWKTKLIETIEEIKNGDSISNISLSMEDEY